MQAHRGYSTWDLQRFVNKHAPIKDRLSGKRGTLARCRARVGAFGLVVDARECEAASLAVELRMRRDFWRGKLALYGDREKFAKHARRSPNQSVVLMGLIWLPFLAFIAIIVFVPALFGWRIQWPSTVFIIVPFGMMAYGLWTRPSLRVRRTLILSLCPDCEYSLAELPDAIELPGEERSGPAVCPECGCPWPLVPPCVPH